MLASPACEAGSSRPDCWPRPQPHCRQQAIAIIAAVSAAAVVGVQKHGRRGDRASKPHRPQEEAIAKSTRPYTDTDVSFSNDGPVKLAGTLSVLERKGTVSRRASHRRVRARRACMKTLAGISFLSCWPTTCFARESLSFATTSVVVGKSTGNFETASFDDLVSDAGVAFRYLKRGLKWIPGGWARSGTPKAAPSLRPLPRPTRMLRSSSQWPVLA